jgi:hypothetical protein
MVTVDPHGSSWTPGFDPHTRPAGTVPPGMGFWTTAATNPAPCTAAVAAAVMSSATSGTTHTEDDGDAAAVGVAVEPAGVAAAVGVAAPGELTGADAGPAGAGAELHAATLPVRMPAATMANAIEDLLMLYPLA